MSTRFSRPPSAAGLTLVELIAALALLSTLLVGILIAFGKHDQQVRQSRQVIDAVTKADKLVYTWMHQGGAVPRDASGTFPGDRELQWKTETVSQEYRQELGIDIVRLQVIRQHDHFGKQLLSLDLPVPSPQWSPAETKP